MKKNTLTCIFYSVLAVGNPCLAQLTASIKGVELHRQFSSTGSRISLKEALMLLKNHYKVDILYVDSVIKDKSIERKWISFSDNFERNFEKILSAHQLVYARASNGTYLISAEKASTQVLPSETLLPQPQALTVAAIPLAIQATPSKDIPVTGTVKDASGMPLPGVSILIKNTTKGTRTDSQGNFKINVPNENAVLVFSYIGYQKQEVVIGKQSQFSIVLKEDNNTLEEVSVVSTGYGSVNKKDHTGATGSVKMSDFEKAPVRSFDEALAGRLAGVQVTSGDGQPGMNADIVIRGTGTLSGSTAPLFVIDGFIQESANFNTINPSDIESIEVLKDASATAIYGARGSNGVIIVTTKRGKAAKPTITINSYVGVQRVAKRMKLMNAYEFVRLQYDINPTWTANNYFTDGKDLESYRNVSSIDWQDKMYQDAPFQNHTVSLAGKSNKTSYLMTGNFVDQKGLLVNSGFNRYQGRIVLDQEVSNAVKIGMTTNYGVTTSFGNIVSTQTVSGNTGSVNDASYSLFYNVWSYRPVSGLMSITELENTIEDFGSVNSDADRFNPYIQATNEVNERSQNALSTNAYIDYKFLKKFKLRITGGVTLNNEEQRQFYNSFTRTGSPYTRFGVTNGPNGSISTRNIFNYQNENLLFYDTKINKDHTLGLLVGATFQKNTSNSRSFSALQVPNEVLGVNGLDEGVPFRVGVSSTLNTMMSYLGRINYSYKTRYSLTASIRADGSSKFRPENQWGYFPSAAVAWRFTEEPTFKKWLGNSIISEGKLRGSFGITGNNRVSDFATYATITTPFNSRYVFNNVVTVGSAPSTIANPNLTWETSSMLDLGLEVGLLNNRLNLEVDYYKKKTYDLLLNATIASTTGFSSAFQNIGDIQNEGLEFTWNSLNVKAKDFSWSTNLNISFNRNKVLKLANNENAMLTSVSGSFSGSLTSYSLYIAKVGQPVSQFHGFLFDGLYQVSDFDVAKNGTGTSYILKDGVPYYGTKTSIQPGDVKLKDLNGDGLINASDNTVIGNPYPLHFGGFSNAFTYKGFDLNIFFQWSYGNEVFNANRIMMESTVNGDDRDLGMNMFETYVDRWSFTNQSGIYPRARTNAGGVRVFSDRHVEDGSFLRLKTISVGYNVPAKYLKKAGISAMRIYGSAQNLKTWTNYQGPDPEVSTRNSALTPAFDFSPYPRAKVIVFGLNLTL